MVIKTNKDLFKILNSDLELTKLIEITSKFLGVNVLMVNSKEELIRHVTHYINTFAGDSKPYFIQQQTEEFNVKDIFKC